MLLRPTVLVWQALRILQRRGGDPRLSVDDIQSYLMRCKTNADCEASISALEQARHAGPSLEPLERGRRNAQDWVKFLLLTPLFDGETGANAHIRVSTFGLEHSTEIDDICSRLADPATFWLPGALDATDRERWYAWFGSVDLTIAPIPREEMPEAGDGPPAPHDDPTHGAAATAINLRPFEAANLGAGTEQPPGGTVHATYDAGMATRQAQRHDLMVLYVARVAARNGALVWDDPDTVDLLLETPAHELIVEVKSVTPRNFVTKIRMALGQLLQYDFLRGRQTQAPRRKIVAVPARVSEDSWVLSFLDHIDVDLLSLDRGRLVTHSSQATVHDVFAPGDAGEFGA